MRRLGHFLHSALIPFSSLSSIAKAALVYVALLSGLSAIAGTAAVAASGEADAIPQDAIRIRILANSDSPFDQRVKREVQRRVAAVIESWGAMPGTHDEARALIASHLPEIRETADRALNEMNVSYGAAVELAEVPFPDKKFHGRKYEAGDYEALRITLGGGQGANWWCVLFPPLCLTAATASDDAASRKPAAAASAGAQGKAASAAPAPKKASASAAPASPADDIGDAAEAGKPQPKFFLWELLQKLLAWLGALFS